MKIEIEHQVVDLSIWQIARALPDVAGYAIILAGAVCCYVVLGVRWLRRRRRRQ